MVIIVIIRLDIPNSLLMLYQF